MRFGGSCRRVETRRRRVSLLYAMSLDTAYPLDEPSFLLKKVACIFNIHAGSKTL
jgi:hypothetical protein